MTVDDNATSVPGYMVSNSPGYSSAGQFYNIAPAPSAPQGYNASGFRPDESGRNFFPEGWFIRPHDNHSGDFD